FKVLCQIPYGKATSYGHVAKLIGMPDHSRHVGQALEFLGPDSDVPWQCIVSTSGQISSCGPQMEGAERQRQELESEGVTVT
ncbi:DNA binding methylated-DNA--cysteine S-methyltransferase, partial [Hysterangium stoloniferum]